MEIKTETLNSISVIRISGKIDAGTVASFESAVKSVNVHDGKKILLNLSSLTYINSGGLRVIIATAKNQKNAGSTFVLCGLIPEVSKVFSLAGLDTILPIFSTETDAISHMC